MGTFYAYTWGTFLRRGCEDYNPYYWCKSKLFNANFLPSIYPFYFSSRTCNWWPSSSSNNSWSCNSCHCPCDCSYCYNRLVYKKVILYFLFQNHHYYFLTITLCIFITYLKTYFPISLQNKLLSMLSTSIFSECLFISLCNRNYIYYQNIIYPCMKKKKLL